ncbi:MAG: hypothetical protein ABIR70_01760 [Bryobacteraceae bacterium]
MNQPSAPSNPLPQPTTGDHVHLVVKAAISAIPVAGGPAAEFFAAVLAPPLSKRREEWFSGLAAELADIAAKVEGFSVEALVDDEAFISAAMEASHAAQRTHRKEKLEALRNAVLNVAIGRGPEEEEQTVFLGWIQDFTTWHLKILDLYRHTEQRANAVGLNAYQIVGAPEQVLLAVYPQLANQRESYDRIVTDLHQRGLFSTSSLHGMMSGQGIVAKRTTGLADRFLDFITVPGQ